MDRAPPEPLTVAQAKARLRALARPASPGRRRSPSPELLWQSFMAGMQAARLTRRG